VLNPLKTSSYDFTLPNELIATEAASPRESAKLLVYDRKTDTITHTIFSEIEKFLPPECAIIFNDTKVIKARLFGKKTSGGKVELLINRALNAHDVSCYIRGKVKVETQLHFDESIEAKVTKLHEDGSREVNFYLEQKLLRFEELLPYLEKIGHVPLPPYINREDNRSDELEYQSVWAKYEGAVAAPTASLHFSDELFKSVCSKHEHAFVTLHVGSGTFKPVESEDILDHPMHSEYYAISSEAKQIIDGKKSLLSVGTTSTRTIEYFMRHQDKLEGEANGSYENLEKFKDTLADLIENFSHLKESVVLSLSALHIHRDNLSNRLFCSL